MPSSSTQCSVLYNLQTGAEAGTTLTLRDSDGNVLMSYEVPNAFTSVNISCPEMKIGETYTIAVGETEETVTLEEITTTSGAAGDAEWRLRTQRSGWTGREEILAGEYRTGEYIPGDFSPGWCFAGQLTM